MTNNLSKPQIRFKGFTEAWEQRKLGDIATIVGGGTPSTANESYWNGNINWFSPAELGEQNYVYEFQNKITKEGLEHSSAKLLPIGTVLFTSRAGIGKTAILAEKACTNQGFQSIVPIKECLDSYFIYSCTNQLKKYGETKGAGSTFVEVSGKQMSEMLIKIPNQFDEQLIVGSFFKKLDSLITLHQRKLIFLKSHRFLMSVLFCYSWEQRKLGDIGKTFTGLSGKTSDDFGHGDAKFLPYLNIFNNPIADINFLESTEIDKSQNEIKYGDVFFTTSSETPEEVGMSSVWLGNSENIYLNSFCFGFRPLIDFNPYYFGYLLRSDTFRNPVTILAQGISRFNISKNKVMEIEIPLPEKQEQEKIGQLFYKLDSLITLHQRKQL